MPKVGLATGVERREILRKAAYYIRSETAKQISSKLIIMPRVSPPGADMVRTKGDAIRGVLEELINFHDDEIKYFEFEEIVICGNTAEMEGMDQFSLSERMQSLPIRMENLYENGPWDEVEIQDVNGDSTSVRVNRQIKKSKFRVSISVPSSDPAFGMYGSLQNMIFAVHPADRVLLQGVPEEARLSDDRAKSVSDSMLLPDIVRKKKFHPDRYNITHEALKKQVSAHRETDSEVSIQFRTLYRNLSRLAEHVLPDLAYVDGTYVVDGQDTRLDGGFALSGDDPVAVDTVLAEILGMDVSSLGHLQYLQDRHHGCADPGEISVAMGDTNDLDIEFTPHPNENQRLDWRHVRLPDENGEAVGYIPPEDESDTPDEDVGEAEAEGEVSDEEQASTSEAADSETESTEEEEQKPEGEAESAADSAEEAKVEGDSVRERVRDRLKKRGKLEGEGSESEKSSDSAAEGGDETTDEEAESEAGDSSKQEPKGDEEKEIEDEMKEEADASEPAAEPVEEAGDEDLSVRERVRRRLIRRGKLEGELPDGEDQAAQTVAEEETATEDESGPSEEEEHEEKTSKDKQQAEAETEEAEETEPADQTDAGSSGEGDGEPDDVRERVRHRLIRRGKLEGELPDEEQQGPSGEEASEQQTEDTEASEEASTPEEEDTTSDQSQEKLDGKPPEADADDAAEPSEQDEPEQVDEVEETVEVTERSGPTLTPSDEVQDSEDVLANLSQYDPEDKIRRRLAIRKQAVEGTEGDRGKPPEGESSDEVESDANEEEETQADQTEQDEQTDQASGEEDTSSEEGSGESGFSRDPDAPLRERVKERLSKRGKLD